MTHDRLRALYEKLSGGDPAAAEEFLRAYEPYLRMVVRRQLTPRLRPKFDSTDVVQSIWADVMVGFREGGWRFTDADHLRAFLVKLTYNPARSRGRASSGTGCWRSARRPIGACWS
jgi:DNA-directed RNA polymerase specialized sigma24 family protein